MREDPRPLREERPDETKRAPRRAQRFGALDERPAPAARAIAGSLALDAALVVVFTAIGRASHDENVLLGLWTTAWPFLAALIVGWLAVFGWRAPAAPLRTGLGVWAVTVGGGMLLRAASGQGTAVAFIIVAAVTLLVFLVGWRVLAALISRRRVPRR